MIARATELASVLAARRRGEAGVVVSAARGMGRTTLAEAAVQALRADGVDVLAVRATATSRSVSLAALAPLVLHRQAGAGPVQDAIDAALLDRARGGGLTIVIDDAHLLDDASSTTLAGLVDAGSGAFVLATASDTAGPSILLDHPALSHVRLGPLDVAAVADMLGAAGLGDEDADAWLQRTGGNPATLLRLVGGHEPGTALELAVASDATRRVLEAVAVAETLSLAAATALTDAGDGRAVADALDTDLVVADTTASGTELRYRWPADADAVLAALPALRRRAVVRATVEAIRDDPRSTVGGSPRLVDLARRSGVDVTTEELRAASRSARLGDDGELALRLARAAAANGDVDDVRRWVDIASARADDDALDEALTALGAAADVAVADDRAAVDVTLRVAAAQRDLRRRDDPEGALRYLDPDTPRLVGARAEILALLGRAEEAIRLASPLLDHPDPVTGAPAAFSLAHAARQQGSPTEALAMLDRVDAGPHGLVGQHLAGLLRVMALLDAARWDDAEDAARQLRRRAGHGDDLAAPAWGDLALGIVCCERGRIADASRSARAALAGFSSSHQPRGARWAWSLLALTDALGGDGDAARAALGHVPDHGDRRGTTTLAGLEARARAWAMPTVDETAERLHAEALELIAATDIGAAVQCLHDLAILGRSSVVLEGLDGLHLDADEPMTALRSEHVGALAVGDHQRLAALASAFAARGGVRLAVECAAAAADRAARAGDRRAARSGAQDALSWAAACPDLATPGLVAVHALTAAVLSPLTERERDVALRAAAGSSNRAIADELGISERTVETHLSRCYDKLHVRTRAALAASLGLDRR